MAEVHYTIDQTRRGWENPRRRVVGERFEVLERFWLVVDDPELAYLLELGVDSRDGTAKCVELCCRQREGGPPVTAEGLRRVRVSRYLADPTIHEVWQRRPQSSGRTLYTPVVGGDDLADYLRARRREERRGRRRITDDDLRRVADVYRVALASGAAPTAEVEAKLRLQSRAQAARWVAKAREAGYLDAAPGPRKAGERVPKPEKRPSRARRTKKARKR